MAKKIKQEIFLENLVKWESGAYKGSFNWNKNINKLIPFIYGDIEGILEIINYTSENQQLTVKYNDKEYKYLTIHSAKGLEEDFVILLNVSNSTYGLPNKIENHNIFKNTNHHIFHLKSNGSLDIKNFHILIINFIKYITTENIIQNNHSV